MSKLSIFQEKAQEAVKDLDAFEIMQSIADGYIEFLVASTYLTAIEDAIAAVPKEEPIWNEEAGNKSPTHATASAQAIGFKRCRTELLNRLEALKRV